MDPLEQLIARVTQFPLKPGMVFSSYLSNLMPLVDQALLVGYSRRAIWDALCTYGNYDRTLRAFYATFDRVKRKLDNAPPRKATAPQAPLSLGSHPLAGLALAVEKATSHAAEPENDKPENTKREASTTLLGKTRDARALDTPAPTCPLPNRLVTNDPLPPSPATSLPGMPSVIKPSHLPQVLERIESGLDPLDEGEPGESNDIRSRHARTVDEIFSSKTVSNPLLGKK